MRYAAIEPLAVRLADVADAHEMMGSDEQEQENSSAAGLRQAIRILQESEAKNVMDVGATSVKQHFAGMCIKTMSCGRCGQTFTMPTEKPYNACPYCFARLTYHGGRT